MEKLNPLRQGHIPAPSSQARSYMSTCLAMEEKQAREELLDLAERLARDLTLSANDLRWLSRFSSVTLRRGVAGNPNTPSDLLRSLSQSVVPLIRAASAANPFISADTLTGLALREKDPQVLSAIAQHPVATPDTLMLVLAGARDHTEVRVRVASNPVCDRGTLMFLADEDENTEVLSAVAAHPNSPAPLREALEQLLTD
ncbi:hypothetical protein FQ330_03355 [Agrococcus sediminis]|uniref:Uncharacterized protein n=1 Tax=Agrococcus sediminis TaxID=2599924 RepID=A0A5M8QPI3_9MICO|nr:hypothetical protein [Agrococcus sediminis]KAA6436453.1 hypothetical protein FQ330_03355 [Agrococcus sediminis]